MCVCVCVCVCDLSEVRTQILILMKPEEYVSVVCELRLVLSYVHLPPMHLLSSKRNGKVVEGYLGGVNRGKDD